MGPARLHHSLVARSHHRARPGCAPMRLVGRSVHKRRCQDGSDNGASSRADRRLGGTLPGPVSQRDEPQAGRRRRRDAGAVRVRQLATPRVHDPHPAKVRRIRRNPRVLVASCRVDGKPRSDPRSARADVLTAAPELARIHRSAGSEGVIPAAGVLIDGRRRLPASIVGRGGRRTAPGGRLVVFVRSADRARRARRPAELLVRCRCRAQAAGSARILASAAM